MDAAHKRCVSSPAASESVPSGRLEDAGAGVPREEVSANDPAGGCEAPAATAMRTVDTALRAGERALLAVGIEGARIEATLLLGDVLGCDRTRVIASLAKRIDEQQAAEFEHLLGRRAAREPLQYLRGKAPFCDFELAVDPSVLIPRPETEGLVEKALELWDPQAGRWAVDVGTGSGAIAIAMARRRADGWVLGIDRSTPALHTAGRNAAELGVRSRVALVKGNFLRALDMAPDDIGVIVSNPPYVADGDQVDAEIRLHEPREAWASGPTGLEAYQRIIPEAVPLLRPGRWLVLEIGYGQQHSVRELFTASGAWDELVVDEDFRGIARIVAGRRSDHA